MKYLKLSCVLLLSIGLLVCGIIYYVDYNANRRIFKFVNLSQSLCIFKIIDRNDCIGNLEVREYSSGQFCVKMSGDHSYKVQYTIANKAKEGIVQFDYDTPIPFRSTEYYVVIGKNYEVVFGQTN